MKVTLIDSPFANVANIARALRACGADLHMTAEPESIVEARKLVLPGVGSFGAAMGWLRERKADAAILEAVARGASLLGICVGHQLLFDVSFEMGETRGLSLLRGEVRRWAQSLPLPQIGWNRIDCARETPLFANIPGGTRFYFVNSYAVVDAPDEIARADYGGAFTAAACRDRVFGVQFHPEKSSVLGLQVLRNFITWN